MARCVAFLRGINVGGHSVIKMDELRELVAALGFEDVSTYKQSGNLIFEAKRKPDAAEKLIREALSKKLGRKIEVFIYEPGYLKKMVALNPFKGTKINPSHLFVTLFAGEIPKEIKLPGGSPKGEVEIVLARDKAIFWTLDLSKGQYNGNFIEKLVRMPSTTRNWRSITEIEALL